MKQPEYTIAVISDLLDISPQTIRLYEHNGIIRAHKNENNGYRFFNRVHLNALAWARSCRAMGFSTFVFFFILIGNLGRISAIREALQALLYGREVLVSFLSCQLISNVPAAVLLSEFTDRYDLLLAGVNIGGLGTLIASMASLISYKYFAQIPNVGKGKYLLWFTLANLLFAIVLLGLAALLPS